MKIAFSTEGKDLNASLNPRFGRCSGFLVLDTAQKTFVLLDNTANRDAVQGAGIQAAQLLAGNGVQALVTGYCGPKASEVLSRAKIPVYEGEEKSLRDLATAFEAGKLRLQTDDSLGGKA